MELVEGKELGLVTCEGSGDVVGVLTLFVGGVAQAFHDDKVVELRVQFGVTNRNGEKRAKGTNQKRPKEREKGPMST